MIFFILFQEMLNKFSFHIGLKKYHLIVFFNCCKFVEVCFDFHSNQEIIGEHSFANSGIRCNIIPPKIKEIQSKAFKGWQNLTDIIIPNSVFTVAKDAFINSFNDKIKCF